MEIKELVEFYINDSNQTLNVSFRLLEDSEDELRTDQIGLDEIKKYGYDFLEDKTDILKEMFDDEEFEGQEYFDDQDYFEEMVDENELISFLNEYYIINPKKIPNPEIF